MCVLNFHHLTGHYPLQVLRSAHAARQSRRAGPPPGQVRLHSTSCCVQVLWHAARAFARETTSCRPSVTTSAVASSAAPPCGGAADMQFPVFIAGRSAGAMCCVLAVAHLTETLNTSECRGVQLPDGRASSVPRHAGTRPGSLAAHEQRAPRRASWQTSAVATARVKQPTREVAGDVRFWNPRGIAVELVQRFCDG